MPQLGASCLKTHTRSKVSTSLFRRRTLLRKLQNARQEEFERTYRELDSIPAKIDRLSLKLSQINAGRKQLADAEAKFKSLYSGILRSAQTHAGLLTDMAGMVATKPQRLEVPAEIEGETNAELSTLQARERELRKLLGIK